MQEIKSGTITAGQLRAIFRDFAYEAGKIELPLRAIRGKSRYQSVADECLCIIVTEKILGVKKAKKPD